MKLLKIIFLSVILTLLASCAKEVDGFSSESVAENQETVSVGCPHSNLVHHPAVAATAQTRGNIEYWSCPDCGKRFTDAVCSEEYTGRIYILPTRFIDPSCMAGYNPFPQVVKTKDGVIAVFVATVAGLAVSIGGLITTCASYSDDCQEIVEEIAQVTAKERKSASDLAYLEDCMATLSVQMKFYCEDMDRMQAEVDTMIQRVSEATEILQSTGEILTKSLASASQVDERIRLHNLFDTRYREITTLEVSTSSAWAAISELLHKGMDLLPYAKTALDSADVLMSKTRQIEAVVSAWGSDWSYPAQTAALLESYNRMDADYGSTYVKLLDEYSNGHFVWEHQEIAFKMMMLQYDFTVLSQAYALSTAYYKTNPDLEEVYKFYRINSMEEDFDTMTTLAAQKAEEYQEIYTEGDRVCNATGKSFAIDAKRIYPNQVLSSLALSCQNRLSEVETYFWKLYELADTEEETMEKAVDDYDLELFIFGSAYSNLWDICFNTDAGAMGFRNSFPSDFAHHSATMVPFEYRTEFGHNAIWKDITSDMEVWHNCRADDLQLKEVYLGQYQAGGAILTQLSIQKKSSKKSPPSEVPRRQVVDFLVL